MATTTRIHIPSAKSAETGSTPHSQTMREKDTVSVDDCTDCNDYTKIVLTYVGDAGVTWDVHDDANGTTNVKSVHPPTTSVEQDPPRLAWSTTTWSSGAMVLGASNEGRTLLRTDATGTETLQDTFTIDLGTTHLVQALFVNVQWPMIENERAVLPYASFRVAVLQQDAWVHVGNVSASSYGLRINTERRPWKTQKIQVTLNRTNVGNTIMNKYKLVCQDLIVRCVPAL